MKMFLEPNDIYLHSGFVDFEKVSTACLLSLNMN